MDSMQINKYHYTMVRVDYPRERGYRMESRPLPDYMHLTITEDRDSDSKWLTFYSRLHVNGKVRVGPAYSASFSDHEIIQDLSGDIAHRFF